MARPGRWWWVVRSLTGVLLTASWWFATQDDFRTAWTCAISVFCVYAIFGNPPPVWTRRAAPENTDKPCKYGDPTCPCQDGLECHYEGENPMSPPESADAPSGGARGHTTRTGHPTFEGGDGSWWCATCSQPENADEGADRG